jgi:Cupin domain
VLTGEVTFRVDGRPVVAGPGAQVVVPVGTRHSFRNTGTDTAHLEVEADPALQLRESIEEGASLARTERFTAAGRPRSLRALIEGAALARRYRDTVVLSSPPPVVQRMLFPLLARFASGGP